MVVAAFRIYLTSVMRNDGKIGIWGIPGTRRLHRRTLEALRLRKCNRTVVRWNTPTVWGMLQQVKRLVVIEAEDMYKAREEKEANHRALRSSFSCKSSPSLFS
ncbi:Ribosomal protein L30, ferredoxin-like fold domain [Dillenia turbinata]|uniref:Large ribosomal subunit protein uL30m n=1 Tax=Dillenia turbinata TaxID=194707 RepID=A0AAN8YZK2_9MAGN